MFCICQIAFKSPLYILQHKPFTQFLPNEINKKPVSSASRKQTWPRKKGRFIIFKLFTSTSLSTYQKNIHNLVAVYASEGVSDAIIDPSEYLHDKKRAKRSQEPLADKVTVKGMQCNAGKSSLAASLSLPLHVRCS